MLDEVLDFYMFPFISHVSTNIRDWFLSVMEAEELPAAVWVGVTPDGAADGKKALRMIPGIEKRNDTCNLHQLQRSILYAIGLAGTVATRKNPDAKDLVAVNGRVTKLQNQSREVNNNVREVQEKSKVPVHQTISGVHTNHTRWNNVHSQAERNNLMRPILTPVLANYKRENPNEVAVLEIYTSDDDSDGETQPRGQFSEAARTVERRKVGFTDEAWEANLQLEGFLRRPSEIKEAVEKKPTLTGAQSFQLHYYLMKGCRRDKPLAIQLFPETMAVKHRKRQAASIRAESLHPLVVEGRKVLVEQLSMRFFTTMPSEGRLGQIWMSKQVEAVKVLPEDWAPTAEAFYVKWLRETAAIQGTVTRRSPPRLAKSKKRRTSGGGFFDQESASEAEELEGETEGVSQNDVVLLEIAA